MSDEPTQSQGGGIAADANNDHDYSSDGDIIHGGDTDGTPPQADDIAAAQSPDEDDAPRDGATRPPLELIHDDVGPHDVMRLASTLERAAKSKRQGGADEDVAATGHPELIRDSAGPHDVMRLASTLERTVKGGVAAPVNVDDNNAAGGSLEQDYDAECEPFHPSMMDDAATTKILANDRQLQNHAVLHNRSDLEDQERIFVEQTPPQSIFNNVAYQRDNIYRDEEEEDQSSVGDERIEEYRTHTTGATLDLDAEAQTNSSTIERGNSSMLRITEAWEVETADEGIIASNVEPILPWYEQKSSRLYTWVLLCFFSAIALTAYKTDPNYNPNAQYHNWSLQGAIENLLTPLCAISLSSSAVTSLIHLSGDNAISRRFVGTILEAALSLILAIIWFIAIIVIMSPHYELGVHWVDGVIVIKDANLFFSSWGALICTGINIALYLEKWQRTMSECVRRSCMRSLSARRGMGMGYTILWSLLALASGTVLILSVSVKCVVCNPGTCSNWGITSPEGTGDDSTCSRNEYGIVTGEQRDLTLQ